MMFRLCVPNACAWVYVNNILIPCDILLQFFPTKQTKLWMLSYHKAFFCSKPASKGVLHIQNERNMKTAGKIKHTTKTTIEQVIRIHKEMVRLLSLRKGEKRGASEMETNASDCRITISVLLTRRGVVTWFNRISDF